MFSPLFCMHAENFEEADKQQTPLHIVPEWYFLLFYGILRSVPSKILGILLVVIFFAFLFMLPFLYSQFIFFKTMQYSFFNLLNFYYIVFSLLLITYFGGKPINDTYVSLLYLETILIYYFFFLGFFFCCYFEYFFLYFLGK